jgi:O-antigen/teichoic acid export membrane protein
VLTTYYVRYMLREIDWGFSWRHLSEPMKFILPSGPASFVEGLNGTLDRFVLEKYAPLDVLGIYTLGRQFGAAFNFVNTILKTAWHPFVINVALQRSDAPAVIGRFSLLYLSILLLPALLISTLAQDFIRLTGQSEYFAVANFVPWFVLGYMFLGIGVIYGRGIEIAKKAHLFWLMPMSTLITNVVCVIVLIPKFGVWGAVAGFLLTFLIREVVQISLAFYSYPRPLFVRRIFGIFGLVSFAFVSTYWLKTPSEITNILVKGSICILVWLATLPLAIEREQLAKIWTKIKK